MDINLKCTFNSELTNAKPLDQDHLIILKLVLFAVLHKN